MSIGKDLILIHGWGLHSGIWQPVRAALEKKFRVHGIDLPGYGKNQTSSQFYTLEKMAESILAVAPKQAIYVGWSLGGLVATYIAHHYPERVEKLITITSNAKFIAEETWPGMEAKTLDKFGQDLENNYEATLLRFLTLQLYYSKADSTLLQQLKSILFLHGAPSVTVLQSGLKILQETDLRTALQKIQCSTLHIFGRLDRLVPEALVSRLKYWVPNHAIYLMKQAGHIPFLSHPSEFLGCVENFIVNAS